MASASRPTLRNLSLHATDTSDIDMVTHNPGALQNGAAKGGASNGHAARRGTSEHPQPMASNGRSAHGGATNGRAVDGLAAKGDGNGCGPKGSPPACAEQDAHLVDDRLEQLVGACQDGDHGLRNRLVERLRPMVRSMARTMALRLPKCVDPEDLEHAGLWGVMQSLERFDPRHGAAFLPFMRIRVRGAMLDELRTLDVLPRPTRQRLRQREDALAQLRLELAREPSHDELAEALGTTPAVLDRDQQLAAPWLGGALRPDANNDPVDSVADEGAESPVELLNRQDLLAKIEGILPEVEWRVLRMLYLEGRTGKDVAAELELSAARVCQIHQRGLGRLKERLADRSAG